MKAALACALLAACTPRASAVDAGHDSIADADADAGDAPDEAAPEDAEGDALSCPDGMVLVRGTYCPKVERTCRRSEENGANHITICHAFAHETKCVAEEEERAFCIDRLEFPNKEGEHPSWMVTWSDAQATCLSEHKRLCYATEWTMACEGPEKWPFPYGWERDNTACNSDNPYIAPKLDKIYGFDAGDAETQAELARLDQSAPSGSLARCVSGYGVRDMAGNFDEWVIDDEPPGPEGPDTGKWAALKGGAWGHVRSACRPMTTSHAPGFSYYFVSFRCCTDAEGAAKYAPPVGAYPAPSVRPADRAPRVVLSPEAGAPGPSKHKVVPQW